MVRDGEYQCAMVLVGSIEGVIDGSVVESAIDGLPLTLGGEVDCVTGECGSRPN